jgi:hypothetical protein
VSGRPEGIGPAWQRFLAQPGDLRAALAHADAGRLGQLIPGSGWTMRDHTIYLADHELVLGVRIRLVVAEEEPDLPRFEPEQWKRRLQYLWRDPEASVSLFEQARWGNAELLERLDERGWARTGRLEGDEVSLAALFCDAVDHAGEHIDAIRDARG